MHWDQDISVFIFFSSCPFGGILDTLPLLRFQFRFFCFFTDNQPQIYLSVRELFKKKIIFWYALLIRWATSSHLFAFHNVFFAYSLFQMFSLYTPVCSVTVWIYSQLAGKPAGNFKVPTGTVLHLKQDCKTKPR